jgi:vacuolar-type H+-ATPase subunit E/Vma4
MAFIKKSFSLNGHKPYDKVITNTQIGEIAKYNNILSKAWQHSQAIEEESQLQINTKIEEANTKASEILDLAQAKQEEIIFEATQKAQQMIQQAEYSVQDILTNSEHRASQEVWDKAEELILSLEQAHQKFYENGEELLNSILVSIIKKLTSNLELQDKMQVLVSQVFDKAKEVEYATLYFNAQDFEHLPSFRIPQTWKVEKDIMLDKGWCRLVGAGGEWKTSIALIERKLLQAITEQDPLEASSHNTTNDDIN